MGEHQRANVEGEERYAIEEDLEDPREGEREEDKVQDPVVREGEARVGPGEGEEGAG